MPWGLRHFQQSGQLHFLTFSCYRRRPNFPNAAARACFESSLERVRQSYELCVYGYVVMPEHVHLLVNEPERGCLAQVLQSVKQSVARTLALRAADPFWQARYYDFNVWSERKFVEKLRYIHRNPVVRGLVHHPADWPWSSFLHYSTGSGWNRGDRIAVDCTSARRNGNCAHAADSTHRQDPAQAELERGTLES